MIRTLALIAVVALGALLLYAATRPDTLRVERSLRIDAPPDTLQPLINDLHAFNTWNPYNRKDPLMKGSYRGPSAGPGAAFDFDGDKNVGKGTISIVAPRGPGMVSMTLDMHAPMEAHNNVDFHLVPQGSATQVTWAMQGASPFIGKLMGIFIDMDKMIGADFEAGLANLKTIAERR
ncbi:MAG TPA: SRPBCC family protein [Rhizobacter sp.]|nr:SRPBCC family protein [Rhizobacter sp.]